MTVEKMLWDVWRNVTSATTGWSLGGSGSSKGNLSSSSISSSSKSGQRTRYSRLKSSVAGRPTKSISQPANLTSLCSTTIYSSSESLEGIPQEDLFPPASSSPSLAGLEKSKDSTSSRGAASVVPPNLSGITPKGRKGTSMKHSISSFFPFTSCTSTAYHTTSTNDKTSQTTRDSSPPQNGFSMMATTSSSSSGAGVESPNNGVALFSNICSASPSFSGSGGGPRGNPTNKVSLLQSPSTVQILEDHSNVDDNNRGGGNPSWDSSTGKEGKETSAIHNQDIICEDDISDLDDDVEHLTCDVCDRAFPTLKQLAAHQRKKRHYGCLQCDSIFPSREVLEYHREQMSHYDYVIDVYEEGEDGGDTDFFESEDDEHGLREDEDCDDEERERLL